MNNFAQKLPGGRLAQATTALIAFAIGAYLVFLVTHIPKSEPSARWGRWIVGDGETMTLVRPRSSRLLTAALSGKGVMTVRAESGAALLEPSEQTLSLMAESQPGYRVSPSRGGINIRAINGPEANLTLQVNIISSTKDARIDIEPVKQHDELGILLRPLKANISVTLLWETAPGSPMDAGLFVLDANQEPIQVQRTIVTIPTGRAVYVGVSPANAKLILDFGDRAGWRGSVGVPIDAVEIKNGHGNQSSVRNLACAAGSNGALKWAGPLGSLDSADCNGHFLVVRSLSIANGLSIGLDGPAFGVIEGQTAYWQILNGIGGNIVLQVALMSINAAFIGWVVSRLKGAKSET